MPASLLLNYLNPLSRRLRARAVPSDAGPVLARERLPHVTPYDPRRPEIIDWIDSLPPESELIVRLAMRATFEGCRADGDWSARVDALIADLAPDGKRLARILREADRFAQTLLASYDAKG